MLPVSLEWRNLNLRRISARLEWLAQLEDGLITVQRISQGCAAVLKDKDQIHLYFIDDSDPSDPKVSGIMSRVSLKDPVGLLGIYMQAMMLSLVVQPNPKRAYVLGFGGGRLPMVLHHFFETIIVESTEIDTDVVALSEEFFGMEFDERISVTVEDGRQYLEKRPESCFDLIMVDCFWGAGASPDHLATREFYSLAKRRMSRDGVMATYFIDADPMLNQKLKTFRSSFDTVYYYANEGANVLIGHAGERIPQSEFLHRAAEIERRHGFTFPFSERAHQLQPLPELPGDDRLALLTDPDERP